MQHLKDIQRNQCENFAVHKNLSTWLSFVSTPNYLKYPFSHPKYLYTFALSPPQKIILYLNSDLNFENKYFLI